MVKWLIWRVEYLRSFLKLAEWSCHVLGSDALAGAAATILYWGVTLRRKDNWGNDRVGSKKQVGALCLWGACDTNTGPWENALAQKLQLLIWTRRTLMLHESLVSAFISCPSLGWRSPWVPERAKVAKLYPGVKNSYLVGTILVPSEMTVQNRLTIFRTTCRSWVEAVMGQGSVGPLLDQDCWVTHTTYLLRYLSLNFTWYPKKSLMSLDAFIYSNVSSVALLNTSPTPVFHHYCLLNCCFGWEANLSLLRLPEPCHKSLVMVLAWSTHLGASILWKAICVEAFIS